MDTSGPLFPPPSMPLPPAELRVAPLGDGAHALLEVLGRAQAVLLLALSLRRRAHRLGEVPAHRLADRAHGERRAPGELAGQRRRLVAQALGRHEAVGEADRVRLLALDAATGVEQVERPLVA